MPVTNLSRVKSIVLPITQAHSDSIVTIYQNTGVTIGSELMEGYKIIGLNTFIKNLKVFASIKSLAEAALPDIQLEDSSAQKLQKVLDIEWKSARKQLNLFIATSNSDWQQVGSISLLNPSGYSFRIYNLMDLFTDNLALELGDNSKIGVQIQNVGYGLLIDADTVTVHGSYVEEFFLQSNELPININVNGTGGGTVSPTPTPTVTDYSFSNETFIDNSFLVGN